MMVALAGPARAEDGRLEALERELASLRGQVEELQRTRLAPEERLDEIERRLGVLAAELEDLKIGGETVVADTAVNGFGPAASKAYRVTDGLSIGGYGEWLYQRYGDTREDGSPAERRDTIDALRAVLYVGYAFADRFHLNTELEVEHASTESGGEVALELASLDWQVHADHGLRAGLLLVPMGLVNELHEPTTYLGARRPETERRIIPSTWSEMGLGAFGSVGSLSYRAYVMNGLDASGFEADGLREGRQGGSEAAAESFAGVARLDWTAAPGVLIGASLWSGDSGQGLESVDGRRLGVRTTIAEAHVDWRWRGLRSRGLWAQARLDDVAELNRALGLSGSASIGETLEGWYLEGGYDLLAGRGGRSTLTPFVRWEELDTQASVPSGWSRDPGTNRRILTLGLAYQPIAQLVLKLDWQDVEAGDASGVDQLNVALGYIF